VINSQIRASNRMTFPLTVVSFNHFFIQPAPGHHFHIVQASVMTNTAREIWGHEATHRYNLNQTYGHNVLINLYLFSIDRFPIVVRVAMTHTVTL
jgi:hypothetical protein